MNKHKKEKLGNVVNIQSSSRIFEKEYVAEGIPFYRSKEIIQKHNGTDVSTNIFISEERFSKIKQTNPIPKHGDILLTSVGTIGIPYFVRKDEQFYFKDGNLTWFNNYSKHIDNQYLYFWLLSEAGKEALNSILIGSTQKALTISDLKTLEISLPPLPEQKRIANILSSFDNKIELLREQNKTLENIAQTIFKQWFIDFNFPDSNNKPYKDNGGKMKDSELGMIPEGWEVGKLGDYIEFTNGYAFKSIDYLEKPTKKSFKVFKMGNIKKGGGLSSTTRQDYVDGDNFDHLSKYVLKKGDLLMSMTDMKDKVSLLGHTALINKTGEFIVNQRVGLIRPKDKNFINYPYLYILTNNDPFLSRLRNKANSGVQVNLSTNSIKEILLIIPNTQLLQDFDYIAKNLFEKIFNNEYNIDNLKPIKAALLNKLIST